MEQAQIETLGQDEFDPFTDADLEGMGRRRRRGRKRFEGIDTELWDTGTIATTNTTDLPFFQQPIGQASKTKLDTSMKEAGLISGAVAFDLFGIGVGLKNDIATDIPEDEAREILSTAYLELVISDRDYFSALLTMLPFGGGMHVSGGDSAAGVQPQFVGNGVPSMTSMLKLMRKIRIPQNVHFVVNVRWPTAPTPTAATSMIIRLKGILWRTRV